VREAAKSGNNLAMLARVPISSVPQLSQEIVIAQRLAVHQRHKEKV